MVTVVNLADISDVVRRIVDEFEKFPPCVTDLLNYHKTRDQLTDILIRFVVSMNAYDEAAFVAEVNKLAIEEENIIDKPEEGQGELASDDKYMCARFVRQMCRERPEFVPHFARLAGIGLLTEVVEDFVKPVNLEKSTNLTLVLDGPVAPDYLGLLGSAIPAGRRVRCRCGPRRSDGKLRYGRCARPRGSAGACDCEREAHRAGSVPAPARAFRG